jgi:hypothetical protein
MKEIEDVEVNSGGTAFGVLQKREGVAPGFIDGNQLAVEYERFSPQCQECGYDTGIGGVK